MGNKKSGTPKAELLRLDGKQIDKDGKITNTGFFDFLNLPKEQFADLQKTMTPAQALKFRNHVVRMKIGTSAAMPMICGGSSRCPVKICPFQQDKMYPVGEPCPVESILIAEWTRSYIETLGVDPDNHTELTLINKLVECDIIDYRANCFLGADEEAWTLLKKDTTITPGGTSTTTNLHPILDAKEKAQRWRQNILDSFTATRKETYKRAAALKKRDEEDVGKYLSKMRSAIKKANQKDPSVDKIVEDTKKLEDEKVTDTDWESID